MCESTCDFFATEVNESHKLTHASRRAVCKTLQTRDLLGANYLLFPLPDGPFTLGATFAGNWRSGQLLRFRRPGQWLLTLPAIQFRWRHLLVATSVNRKVAQIASPPSCRRSGCSDRSQSEQGVIVHFNFFMLRFHLKSNIVISTNGLTVFCYDFIKCVFVPAAV